MRYNPADLLHALLRATPCPTAQAPRDECGLYGLVDHLGELRYIGSTSSIEQNFYTRIHQRHRTGSEGMSHYFSQMYNSGRMWRDRSDVATQVDGSIAKKLRNEFVKDHCSAVWLSLPRTADIGRLEMEVLELAPASAVAWNRRGMDVYDEPTGLVDETIRRLHWGASELGALERQRERFLLGALSRATSTNLQGRARRPFPAGPFRFFALDVETANNDRSSICQIGVACVRMDNTIDTWVTYVDPQVTRWTFTGLHGIGPDTVEGAPKFSEILPLLQIGINDGTVYQHSTFDRTAIAAACSNSGLPVPAWHWRDSVIVARSAWPELRGNGGHGLASLKKHLGLVFHHHDAGEDARAAAEVVLRAEAP